MNKRKALLYVLMAIAGLLSLPLKSIAQVKASPENVLASFIYNFTAYLNWPEESQNNDFKIIVLGNDEIMSPLQYIGSKRTIQGRPIVVKKAVTFDEIEDCEMLFIGADAVSSIEKLKGSNKTESTVIITDCKDCLRNGIGINFVNEEDKIRFEINKSALESKNIRISSQLLKLAVKVI